MIGSLFLNVCSLFFVIPTASIVGGGQGAGGGQVPENIFQALIFTLQRNNVPIVLQSQLQQLFFYISFFSGL